MQSGNMSLQARELMKQLQKAKSMINIKPPPTLLDTQRPLVQIQNTLPSPNYGKTAMYLPSQTIEERCGEEDSPLRKRNVKIKQYSFDKFEEIKILRAQLHEKFKQIEQDELFQIRQDPQTHRSLHQISGGQRQSKERIKQNKTHLHTEGEYAQKLLLLTRPQKTKSVEITLKKRKTNQRK